VWTDDGPPSSLYSDAWWWAHLEFLPEFGCPTACGTVGQVTFRRKFVPVPGGSLAGFALKMSVRKAMIMSCAACGIEVEVTPA
jgi:hypothetical protein